MSALTGNLFVCVVVSLIRWLAGSREADFGLGNGLRETWTERFIKCSRLAFGDGRSRIGRAFFEGSFHSWGR